MTFGSGGVLVEKRSGKTIHFGSAYSTDTNLKIYEARYLDHDNYDLVVAKITDFKKALELLNCLSIFYVKPEFERY